MSSHQKEICAHLHTQTYSHVLAKPTSQSEDLQFRGVRGPVSAYTVRGPTVSRSSWARLCVRELLRCSRSQRCRPASRGRKEREGLRVPFSDLVGWAKDTGLLCPGARRTASGAGGEGSWAGGHLSGAAGGEGSCSSRWKHRGEPGFGIRRRGCGNRQGWKC